MKTNLIFYKKSNKAINTGDIFCISPKEGMEILGLVVDNNIKHQYLIEETICILLFNKNIFSESKDDNNIISLINNSDMLIPPIITNKLGWIKGYFKTITSVDLQNLKIDYLNKIFFYYSADKLIPLKDNNSNFIIDDLNFIGATGVKSFLGIEILVQISLDLDFAEIPPKNYNPYTYFDYLKKSNQTLVLPFWYYKAKKRLQKI